MSVSPRAGEPATPELLADLEALEHAYYTRRPDPAVPAERVTFGTSGHRGSSLTASFNEYHILAVTQAICDYRTQAGISGPVFVGKDTHALSAPAERTALEVLAANGVETFIQRDDGYTPTPVISRAILVHNLGHTAHPSDGIVITPSHNPPEDGGFKYNPPNGGPADTDVTRWVQDRANALLEKGLTGVKRVDWAAARRAPTTHEQDFIAPYVADLEAVIDMESIRSEHLALAVDPLGGSSVHYWDAINAAWGLDIVNVNPAVDPQFAFMTLDHDGRIRMDCSSRFAMARLVALRDRYQVAFANDPDADRHGIVTPAAGLMNPNHYLVVAIRYLLTHRPYWRREAVVGKTLVSSGLIDRVVASLGRTLAEVPVGFKWFAPGLYDGTCCFGGEESAGASFLRRDGSVWTTDKDGLILALLAAEITAVTGRDPGEHYREISRHLGAPCYVRIDAPATAAEKKKLAALAPSAVSASRLAGEPIIARLTRAPANDAPIGGLKVVTENGWFAARPSGTEDIYKIYAESFRDAAHLDRIVSEARAIVASALAT